MFSWLIFSILLILLIPNKFSDNILKKNGCLESYTKYAIFESKEFSINDDMYFVIFLGYKDDNFLIYEYFDSIEEA